MRPLRLAVLAEAVGGPDGIADLGATLDRRMDEARAAGADLVLMPEYALVRLPAGRHGADEGTEIAALAQAAPAMLDAMRGAARRAGLWLVPGSLPMRGPDGVLRNRAPLIAPDGRCAFQDKVSLPGFEAERWGMTPGVPPAVFDTPWGRIGLTIGYDIEFPKHARAQVEAGAWLILVPSRSAGPHDYGRVRITAAARAVENQCFVAVAAAMGTAPGSAVPAGSHGAAAVLGPVEPGFPEDGVIAERRMDVPGWTIADLDPARIAAARADGAVRNHGDWPRRPFPRPRIALFS